jgi:PIN domain nuclease of toxin-antitoxin system
MKLLLDTHTFLWFIIGSSTITANARALIEDESNEKFFSLASLWEITIKVSISKLTLFAPFEELFPRQLINNGIELLNIKVEHTAKVAALPYHHRDSFDRLLIAQAIEERMHIVSADPFFDAYPVTRLW